MHLTVTERKKLIQFITQPDPTTLTLTLFLSLTQFSIACNISSLISVEFWLKLFLFGVPVAHALYQCNLEFANNLCFGTEALDRTAGIFSNLATGVPYSELVRHYQTEHRAFYGFTVYHDPETTLHTTPNTRNERLVYLIAFPWNYAYQLLFRHRVTITNYFIWNVLVQLVSNLFVLWMYGWTAVLFLLLAGYGSVCPLHPVVAHMLVHHRSTGNKHGTDSYYGVVNIIALNGGMHRERHKHPEIPWSRLHIVKQLYFSMEPVVSQENIFMILYNFITFGATETLPSKTMMVEKLDSTLEKQK